MTSVDVCIPTFRRPELEQTILSVAAQDLPHDVEVRIIVADNDETPSAQPLVISMAARLQVPLSYVHAPARNISTARNALLDTAQADWIAFIDDDETAATDWLANLLIAAQANGHDIVFGPSLARYPEQAPAWIVARDYHSSIPEARAGEVRTGISGNALLRRDAEPLKGLRFDTALGCSGGEDTDFFFRAWRAGASLGISNAALVFEAVPDHRLTYQWLATRKLRAGQSYGYHAWPEVMGPRLKMQVGSMAKAVLCFGVAGLSAWSRDRRNYWALRGLFHAGIVSTLLGVKEKALY